MKNKYHVLIGITELVEAESLEDARKRAMNIRVDRLGDFNDILVHAVEIMVPDYDIRNSIKAIKHKPA